MIRDDAKLCDRCGQPATDTREGVDLCGACYARKVMAEIEALDAKCAALDRELALRLAAQRHAPKPEPVNVCAFCGRNEAHHSDAHLSVLVKGKRFYGMCYSAMAQGLVSIASPHKRKSESARSLEDKIRQLGLA
jgi:hypothetical protein